MDTNVQGCNRRVGDGYEKIATKLGIRYKTVVNACSSMRAKLKINRLAALIRSAITNDPERIA